MEEALTRLTASDFCIRSLSSSRLAAPPPKGRPNRGSSSAAAAEVDGGGQASLPRTAEGGDEASGGGGVGGEGEDGLAKPLTTVQPLSLSSFQSRTTIMQVGSTPNQN